MDHALSVLKRCVPKTLAFAFGLCLHSKTRCFKTRALGRRLPNGKPQERLRCRLDIFETPTGPPDPRSPKTPQQQKKKFQKPRKPRLSPKEDARLSPKVDARSPKVDARSPKVDARSPKVNVKYF